MSSTKWIFTNKEDIQEPKNNVLLFQFTSSVCVIKTEPCYCPEDIPCLKSLHTSAFHYLLQHFLYLHIVMQYAI